MFRADNYRTPSGKPPVAPLYALYLALAGEPPRADGRYVRNSEWVLRPSPQAKVADPDPSGVKEGQHTRTIAGSIRPPSLLRKDGAPGYVIRGTGVKYESQAR